MHRLRGIGGALSPAEWRRAGALATAIAALHVIGFVTLIAFIVPRHFTAGAQGAFGFGLGITAYTLGLRHAFDADHISAIDNATRKLMSDGKRPLSVGFFFSLGHSTIVFGLTFLLAAGLKALGGQVTRSGSGLHQVSSVVGTGISGGFLCIIGILNLFVLLGVVRLFRAARRGEHDDAALERELQKRGFMSRLYGRLGRTIDEPWKMYPIGILFGLGFDTATEVALLFVAAGAASSGLPFYAILCLPILFAAGMSLLDTIDGAFMNFAYGWAFAKPVRKLYYNITITGLSVAVALIVGTAELASLLAAKVGLHGGVWSLVTNLNLNTLGFVIVGLFVATWLIALSVWHLGRFERRWEIT